jgi:hypothetical protein
MPTGIPDSITKFRIDASDAAAQRPALAAEAGRLFALWANVELALGLMASVLLGDAAAFALLDRIKAREQKFEGIRDAMTDRIGDAEAKELLRPIFKLVDDAARPRNKLAHCTWGTIPELPDALLLIEPKAALKMARSFIRQSADMAAVAQTDSTIILEATPKFDKDAALQIIRDVRKGTEVWRHEDFDVPRDLARYAVIALMHYAGVVRSNPSDLAGKQARRQLHEVLTQAERLQK